MEGICLRGGENEIVFVCVREKELDRSCSLLSVSVREKELERSCPLLSVSVREKELERSCSLLSASLSFVLQFQLVTYDVLALAGWKMNTVLDLCMDITHASTERGMCMQVVWRLGENVQCVCVCTVT